MAASGVAILEAFGYNLRFPGQYYDVETGKHYNYHRDYDPSIGRYLQSDPLGLDAGPNTYEYADSNPLVLFDMYGLASGDNLCAVGGPPKDPKDCSKPPKGLRHWARVIWLAFCLLEGRRPPPEPPPPPPRPPRDIPGPNPKPKPPPDPPGPPKK